jgi:hypothetical protein
MDAEPDLVGSGFRFDLGRRLSAEVDAPHKLDLQAVQAESRHPAYGIRR